VKRVTLREAGVMFKLKIEPELNNLNSIWSRSAVTPVFLLPLAQVKACCGWPLINNSAYPKKHIKERKIVEKGKLRLKQQSFQFQGKGDRQGAGK